MISAGVDVGSTATKAVILDGNQNIIGRGLVPTGAGVVDAAKNAFKQARDQCNLEEWEVGFIVGTGYGRLKVPFGHDHLTEISCHARGANFLFPNTRTILDIGGQDTKGIRIGPTGEVVDFCMNDKCAAGTGRFLENCANVLGVDIKDISEATPKDGPSLKFTNVCTVFVEQEIISHLARGHTPGEILKGVHTTIASRSLSLLRRVGKEPEFTFTGGVSKNGAMVRALEEKLKNPINVSPDSQFIGAIGAALFALERIPA